MLQLSQMALAYPSLAEPNPPTWPDSVKVFSPGDAGIDAALADAYGKNGGHEPQRTSRS